MEEFYCLPPQMLLKASDRESTQVHALLIWEHSHEPITSLDLMISEAFHSFNDSHDPGVKCSKVILPLCLNFAVVEHRDQLCKA